MKLNLGASDRHIPDFLCIDIAPPPCEVCGDIEPRRVDLGLVWPWPDSSVEEVRALDVCEHIPDGHRVKTEKRMLPTPQPGVLREGAVAVQLSRSGRIHFMNELHRILIPGGRATIETPNASRGCGFFQDPSHCSPWCLSTFAYFEKGKFAHTRLADAYGITAAFKVLSLTERRTNGENPAEEAWKITALLEAVK